MSLKTRGFFVRFFYIIFLFAIIEIEKLKEGL